MPAVSATLPLPDQSVCSRRDSQSGTSNAFAVIRSQGGDAIMAANPKAESFSLPGMLQACW